MTDPIPEYLGETKRRSRATAALLTAICPGLGYMYIGQAKRGLVVNLLLVAMIVVFVATFATLKYFPLLPAVVVLAAWATWTYFSIRSVVAQIDPSADHVLKSYNHWMAYGAAAATLFIPLLIVGWFVSSFLLGAAKVEHGTMLPSIKSGDVVLYDRSAYRYSPPVQGDLVAVDVAGSVQVLRVVAVEEDVVSVEGEQVFVNGALLERSAFRDDIIEKRGLLAMVEMNNDRKYVITLGSTPQNNVVVEPTELNARELFVMADNRTEFDSSFESAIRDSRNFGPVNSRHVLGRPVYVGWSNDSDSVRWNRVGLKVQ